MLTHEIFPSFVDGHSVVSSFDMTSKNMVRESENVSNLRAAQGQLLRQTDGADSIKDTDDSVRLIVKEASIANNWRVSYLTEKPSELIAARLLLRPLEPVHGASFWSSRRISVNRKLRKWCRRNFEKHARTFRILRLTPLLIREEDISEVIHFCAIQHANCPLNESRQNQQTML